jgi:hypothetical protein
VTLREFTDKRSVLWRVWDIAPQSLRVPDAAATQRYPATYDQSGWLSFQTLAGTEKRSLSPIPPGWETLSDAELADLLEKATEGAPRATRVKDVARPEALSALAEEISDPGVVRAFVYPGGRAWTVCVATLEERGQPVLRFTCGDRSFDLTEWPANWADLSDESLVILLRRIPRTGSAAASSTVRRRWNDRRPQGDGP